MTTPRKNVQFVAKFEERWRSLPLWLRALLDWDIAGVLNGTWPSTLLFAAEGIREVQGAWFSLRYAERGDGGFVFLDCIPLFPTDPPPTANALSTLSWVERQFRFGTAADACIAAARIGAHKLPECSLKLGIGDHHDQRELFSMTRVADFAHDVVGQLKAGWICFWKRNTVGFGGAADLSAPSVARVRSLVAFLLAIDLTSQIVRYATVNTGAGVPSGGRRAAVAVT